MKPTDNIEKLIRDLHILDINTNAEMDLRILHDTLKVQKECNRTNLAGTQPDIWRKIMKSPIKKLAAVIAVVIGVGAIAVVGVNVRRYFFYKGQDDTGTHIFHSEDWETVVTLDDNQVTDVEQTRQELEEIELLYQQGKRELLKIEITMTNGTLEIRTHVYKYKLSDGRIINMREGAGGAHALAGTAKWQEWRQLRKAGSGEDLGTYEEVVEDRVFSFKREKYILSDGTEAIWIVGTPKQN